MVEDEKDGRRASARAEPEQREQSINALVPPSAALPRLPCTPTFASSSAWTLPTSNPECQGTSTNGNEKIDSSKP